MKKVTKINPYMFNLLIEKGMDDFSVIEARDFLHANGGSFINKGEARKYVYKQLMFYKKKGWLSVIGEHRDKRYQVTKEFKALAVEPRTYTTRTSKTDFTTVQSSDGSLTTLVQEKKQYEGELAITLGEMEEYQSLFVRFPRKKQDMLPLFDATRERSAKLLGKINALTNWIKAVQGNTQKC